MKASLYKILVAIVICLTSCQHQAQYIVTVENPLGIKRSFETIEINKSDLKMAENAEFEHLSVKDLESNTFIISQFVDEDGDGNADVLLFQPQVEANEIKTFQLVKAESSKVPESTDYCYSRFVPERTDDYAWENNKVAFRTFGPTAQKMVEDSVKGGTLTSGIDAWLKKVDYPIINKWYAEDQKEKGAYHKDKGEGLDNFHVGVSRGVGGIAVKSDSIYYISKNFTQWKTITTGPIRTSFILEYADWDAGGNEISETKHISLDYGSHLSKFKVELKGAETIYAGLTLHEKDGEPTQNQTSGWVSYWQPHGDSELGTAVVVPNNNMVSSVLFDTTLKDQSNLFAEIKVENGLAKYYAGFGWKESKDFSSKSEWESYLDEFSLKINNPLKVTIE
ncbi:DUF4861 domain-containing protein [Hyunsoonleella sp. SJ7]|uniref:DUF4861 domain-containing protein n=1 Tax=Hyunsoonleella aquatilis TaxID=2762758 RepID=A0A923HAB4_9FLAO|nr:DUF4861 domain-containing protein [Hyunsoonleella aquatilis]MBC3758644.1 DUF4861 domain-containing protein [Hyunsoonleella aquatilis]